MTDISRVQSLCMHWSTLKKLMISIKANKSASWEHYICVSFISSIFDCGLVMNHMAVRKASDNYDTLMEEAAKSVNYEDKVRLYKSGIAIADKTSDKEAYLGLIKAFKENDYTFTTEEQEDLIKVIKNSKEALIQNPSDYADISFEIGKLFWYYYDYGNGNQITRMKAAIDWFSDTITYADSDYENLVMAKVYRDIGVFYRDVSINTVEASDGGIYKPFFDNINELLTLVESDEKENEIVKLEVYELARNAIHSM